MLKTLYDAIRQDAAPTIIKIGDREYSDKELEPVLMPEPVSLGVTTLTGIVDYLKANIDDLEIKNLLCHVGSPQQVFIMSAMTGPFFQRDTYIQANLNQLKLPFNTWMDAETFNIALQSCFVDDADRALVLKYISQVVAMSEATTADDGISQAVTVKTGIASKALKELPNPVTLRPYRTFTEVEQPVSRFVFRACQDGGKMQYTLVEADGGAWRNVAMDSIKDYMEKALPDLKVIA